MKDAVFHIPKGSLMVEMVNTMNAIYDEIEKEVAEGQHFVMFKETCIYDFPGAITVCR